MHGEDHADRRPTGGPRLNAEVLGELRDERKADAQAGAVATRQQAAALVADVDLQAVAGVALDQDLDVTGVGVVEMQAWMTALVTASDTASAIAEGSTAPCSRAQASTSRRARRT